MVECIAYYRITRNAVIHDIFREPAHLYEYGRPTERTKCYDGTTRLLISQHSLDSERTL